ncbi:MAG: ComF family protein [Woeseiaceae bacterium]|nr:ComF family protein [Woeseiaceae bacterium]
MSLFEHGRWVAGALLDAFLPPSCPFCGLDVERLGACGGCLDDLPWNRVACRRCAKPLATDETLCAECQRRPPPFVTAIAPLRYDFPVDVALKAVKFRARSYYLPVFAGLLCEASEALPTNVDAVLPMPMHWRRWAMRGFNQAVELARPLAKHLDVPLISSVSRVRHTAFQSGLDTRARRSNLAGAFQLTKAISAAHVLIVDDVMTTGHSCRSLALTLRRAGVREVSVLVAARAGGV